jgi:tetratricopeptide (TPR) repeat protein
MKYLIPIAAALLLTGCAEFGARAITASGDAADAARDYVDEVTDRREQLRTLRYDLQDQLIQLYVRRAQRLTEEGKYEEAEAAYEKALEVNDTYYPDLNKLRGEVRELLNREQ